MEKIKTKFTKPQKRAKASAKVKLLKKYEWIFINGKQVRVKRPQLIDGILVDEYIQQNADPMWLHQNEMWEYLKADES